MKNRIIFLFLFVSIVSCDSAKIKIETSSMEGTLKKGETYKIYPAIDIHRNDVIVFAHNDYRFGNQIWIFRVVGIPGDNIVIKNSHVFVNDILLLNPKEVKYSYFVKMNDFLNEEAIKNFEFEKTGNVDFVFYLTNSEKDKLKINPAVIEIQSRIKESNDFENGLIENDTIKKWNLDNYGPIKIPPKRVSKDVDSYFVLGDNRHNAMDSRYIGLVPRTAIIGILKIK